MPPPRRIPGERNALTREHWIEAALTLCAERGFAKVAAEPLAARLGATKGSFYWHFTNRDELRAAMLASWEREHTQAIIELVLAAPPAERLSTLITGAFGPQGAHPAERAIYAAATDPLVAPVVARVHQQRIDFIADLYRAQGLPSPRAALRARILYAAFLGHLDLLGDRLPEPDETPPLVAELLALSAVP